MIDKAKSRAEFARGTKAYLMAIDGSWRRKCTMQDGTDTGVRVTLDESIDNFNTKEFFLLLSSSGLAIRRCELDWIDGSQLGAHFVQPEDPK